jgi:hypothetical protein
MKPIARSTLAGSDSPLTWQYFDRQSLRAWQRRYKPIGRAEAHRARWEELINDGIGEQLRKSFVEDVGIALSWLRSDQWFDGDWRLWELSNGGFYLSPVMNESWRLARDDRTFDQSLTADAAGLCATELVLNKHLFALASEWQVDRQVALLAKRLKDFRELSPEGGAIGHVLD